MGKENILNLKQFTKVYCVDNVLETEIDGETALMSIDSGKYFSMNETASRIWQIMKVESNLVQVFSKLSDYYSVSPEQLATETCGLLGELQAEGLIILK